MSHAFDGPEEVIAGRLSWALVHGDCLFQLSGLARLGDASVDHVITDPPYEAEAHTLQRRTKQPGWRSIESGDDRVTAIESLDFPPITEAERTAVAAQMARVSRRWLLAFCQAEAVAAWRSSFLAGGAIWRRACVWIKPDGMPQLTGDRPGMGYESLAAAHRKGKSRWNGGGKHGVYTVSKNSQVEATGHQTQKPIALMESLIRDFTDPGDIVVDPFAGSGTTGVACIRLGRRFIGWERDAKFYEAAKRRLEQTHEQPELVALETFRRGAKGKRKQTALNLEAK